MDWKEEYQRRRTTAAEALAAVKRGQRVFVATACAEPRHLMEALLARADELSDVEILHFLTLGEASYTEKRFDRRFRHNAFFVGPNTREAVMSGRADYTPVFTHQVPALFRSRAVALDVALIQVSPPNPHGFVSLGVGVDVVKSAAENATTVIAQVNPYMPVTNGDSFLHLSQIHALVEHPEPLLEFIYPRPDPVVDKAARNASRLVNDGDCVHVGYGHIAYSVLHHLGGKRDLGFHSEVVSDAVIDLVEAGVLTGRRKTLYPGKIVCSFCVGSRRMYDYVDGNPRFMFLPVEQVYNPLIIARNDHLVSLGTAMEVDLSGQVSAASSTRRFYQGLGGRLDFMRGAALSLGGKPVIILASTTRDGRRSRIVHHLDEAPAVVATRGDVHYVVTEFGIAYLHGKSVRERAMALINIAHPRFRPQLLEQAKSGGMVYPDQIMVMPSGQTPYPEEADSTASLKGGLEVTIRPIKPTDEVLLQSFFYSHSDETIYNRYFRPVHAMPHSTAQDMVNLDYDQRMALVATTGPIGREEIVGVGRYSRDDQGDLAEVAYTVREDYHGLGLGTLLQEHLARYALAHRVAGFWALVLDSNRSMIHVFEKLGPVKKSLEEPGVLRLEHRFESK